MTTKEALHRLIDELADDEAERLLRTFEDSVLRAVALAPEDDEPETEEERAMVEEAKQELARGEYVSLDDVKRELGLA
jgi:hypothetical protein